MVQFQVFRHLLFLLVTIKTVPPKAESHPDFVFFCSPPKRLPLLSCLLSFISWGMLGKRVASFQTLPNHEPTTIALAGSGSLLSESAFPRPESPSLESDTLTRTKQIKICSESSSSANDCPSKRSKRGARAPAQMRAIPHACLLRCIVTGMDRGGQIRLTAELLSGHQSAHLLTQGQWWADQRAPCAPALPRHPCAHPWPLRPGMILPLSAAVRISSPDNTLSTTLVLNVFSTNFPRHWA